MNPVQKLDDLVERLHSENFIDLTSGDHVTMVWADGEITSTKGGELFGHRTMHRVEKPIIPEGRGPCFFPVERGENAYAIVAGPYEASRIRRALMEWWVHVMQQEQDRIEDFLARRHDVHS